MTAALSGVVAAVVVVRKMVLVVPDGEQAVVWSAVGRAAPPVPLPFIETK